MSALIAASTAGNKYVAAAYLVFLALVVVYVAIMASKISRIERELETLTDIAEHRDK